MRRPLGLSLALSALTLVSLASARLEARGVSLKTRAQALEKLFLRPGPSIPLSQFYASIPKEQRFQLLSGLRQMVLAQLPPGIEKSPMVASLPPELQAKMAGILALAKVVSPEQMDAFVQSQDLDELAPIPVEVFRFYHDKSMQEPVPGQTRPRLASLLQDRSDPLSWVPKARQIEGFRSDASQAPQSLELLSAEDPIPQDEVPQVSIQPKKNGLGVEASFPVKAPAHVLVNSERLAEALNHLANPKTQARGIDFAWGRGKTRVHSGLELVNEFLHDPGTEVAIFDARMFVNFVDVWVPHRGSALPVQIPTWLQTDRQGSDGRPMAMPANHSEQLLAVYKKGQLRPEAVVRWFMAIPSPGVHQGSAWKSAIWQRASWSGYRIVRGFAQNEAVRTLPVAAERLMKLYNFVQDRYRFPHNGYGMMAVCNDTSGILEAVLTGRSGESTIWPMFRDPRFDFYYSSVLEGQGLRLDAAPGGPRVLSIPADVRPDLYPFVKDPKVHAHRLGSNLPFRDPEAIPFPRLKAEVEAFQSESPDFARALALEAGDEPPPSAPVRQE